MAESNTEIGNMALGFIGVSHMVDNLDTDTSQEAKALRRFYNTARDATLRDFAWGFADTTADLVLVEEDPNDDWAFSYQYPVDCMDALRILSGIRNDTRQSRVPFKISQSATQGRLIFCDLEDAQLNYTARVEDPARYPPDFTIAFAQRLGSYVSPVLSGGDPYKLGERTMTRYEGEISRAKVSNADEGQPDEEPDSEFIRSRG